MKRWCLFFCLTGWALAEPTQIRFLPRAEAASVLSQRDEFVRQLSPFDRQARVGKASAVCEEELLLHLAAQARDWSGPQQQEIHRVWQSLRLKLSRLPLPGPETIDLIQTTGRDEGDAAYTRAQAIVLPISKARDPGLESLLTHELFHVLSRANPAWRAHLYTKLGFQPCSPPQLPDDILQRRITNPDAPVLDWSWSQGEGSHFVPVTLSRQLGYDPSQGGMFAFLQFAFWQIPQNRLQPVAAAYREQYGKNTGYLIHPEEILAEHFVFLVQRQSVPDPTLVDQLREWLHSASLAPESLR
jgi:hypothetical protein